MAAGALTLSQMLRHPFVVGVFSRVKPTGLAFQQFYRMGTADVPSEPSNINRNIVYDTFDHSRTLAKARAPMIGPSKIAPKPVGQSSATALRLYESIPFPYEKVYSIRQLGGQLGPLDARGQSWVARQVMYGAERFANANEFMVSRMFRGGFSILIDGEDYLLRELGAGTVDITYPIPAGNKTTVGGIIDSTWDNSSANIITHMLEINKLSQLQSGYEIKHVWVNSTTYTYMLENTQLQTVRGTALRVFDNFRAEVRDTTSEQRAIGFSVVFPSIPQFVFHVYDGSSVVGQETDPEDHTTANNTFFIPDSIAIMTPEPEPGGWYGMYHGMEPIKENDISEPRMAEGLDSWSYPTNDPPGEELRMIHNLTPLLYVPKASFYVTVGP